MLAPRNARRPVARGRLRPLRDPVQPYPMLDGFPYYRDAKLGRRPRWLSRNLSLPEFCNYEGHRFIKRVALNLDGMFSVGVGITHSARTHRPPYTPPVFAFCSSPFAGLPIEPRARLQIVCVGDLAQIEGEPETRSCLLHVTDLWSKRGDLAQSRWTRCNKVNNLQSCQGGVVIRILPEEPNKAHKTKQTGPKSRFLAIRPNTVVSCRFLPSVTTVVRRPDIAALEARNNLDSTICSALANSGSVSIFAGGRA
jgi:hypothetical protein